MRKLLFTLCLLALPVLAHAATIHLTWTVASGATVAATTYRVEEQSGSTWGNLAGTSAATIVTAPTKQYDVTGVTVGTARTFRVVPVANSLDGTPSNACTAGVMSPNEVVSLTCNATNP